MAKGERKPKNAYGLAPKAFRFAEEYPIDLNGKQAAIRAGYSEKTAEQQASRLLSDVKVQAAIQAGLDRRSKRTGIKADDVLSELAAVGFSDIAKAFPDPAESSLAALVNKIPAEARKFISSIKVRRVIEGSGESAKEVELLEIRLWPKLEALTRIGEHLKLFTKNVDVNLSGKITLSAEELRRAADEAESFRRERFGAVRALPTLTVANGDGKNGTGNGQHKNGAG